MKLQIIEPKKSPFIMFCTPGEMFSGKFLDSFSDLIGYCHKRGLPYLRSRKESSVVYYVRNMCLGGNVLRGKNQKPFNGEVDYTHMMWIDSDTVFNTAHFQALLNHDKDIVSGVYKMKDNIHYATVKNWDEGYFKVHGSFPFLTDGDLINHRGLMEVSYTGFGFILIKRGVFESLEYPWFRPLFVEIGDCMDFTSEDVAFCKLVREKGYKIYVDPQIRVGHEKNIVL